MTRLALLGSRWAKSGVRAKLLDGVCRDDELRTELLSAMVSIRRYYVGNDINRTEPLNLRPDAAALGADHEHSGCDRIPVEHRRRDDQKNQEDHTGGLGPPARLAVRGEYIK